MKDTTCQNSMNNVEVYNASFIEKEEQHDWDSVLLLATIIIENLENDADVIEGNRTPKKDIDIYSMKFKIQYFSALIAMHTKPLKNVKYCSAYNLIASVLESGDFMIFGDWCLYYGLTEAEFVTRWKTDKELQLVWSFFDTLYNKLSTLKIIDNNALLRYEKSRASGYLMPYTERAIVADVTTKNKILLERGEEVARQLMEEDIE